MQPTPPPTDDQPAKNSRRGCWLRAALILAIGAGGLYYIVFHTAIPARFLLSRATEKDTFEAEGVGGSIASGKSSIDVMRYDTGAETMSEFYGFEINYPGSGPIEDGRFAIESILFDRVVLYLDSQNLGRPKDEKPKDPEGSKESPKEPAQANRGFQMGKLEIPEVTIKVVDLGWTLDFSRGLTVGMITAGPGMMDFGGLTLDGDGIRIEIPPFVSTGVKSQPAPVAATVTIRPALHPTVKQPIQIEITQTFLDERSTGSKISTFGTGFRAETVSDKKSLWALRAENLTVDDFVTEWFPGTDLSVAATYDQKSGHFVSLTGGSFEFEGERFSFVPFENNPTNRLHANAESGSGRVQLTLTFADGFASPTVERVSESGGASGG